MLFISIVSVLTLHAQVYMYGTTYDGGAHGYGTIYRTDLNGQNFEKVFDFTAETGGNPVGGLTLANNGKLYGFTTTDGLKENPGATFAFGSFYEFDPVTFGLTVITYIDELSDFGYVMNDSPLLGSDGKLYMASAYNPVLLNDGKMWSYDVTTGVIQALATIDYDVHGSCDSRLMQASDGNIYFTTQGSYIVRFDPQTSSLTVLHESRGNDPNDYDPGELMDYVFPINNPLFEASNGMLYGCSRGGGNSDRGALFKINKDGTGYQTLYAFAPDLNDEGFYPAGGFVERNGLLYSATSQQGAFNFTRLT